MILWLHLSIISYTASMILWLVDLYMCLFFINPACWQDPEEGRAGLWGDEDGVRYVGGAPKGSRTLCLSNVREDTKLLDQFSSLFSILFVWQEFMHIISYNLTSCPTSTCRRMMSIGRAAKTGCWSCQVDTCLCRCGCCFWWRWGRSRGCYQGKPVTYDGKNENQRLPQMF